MVSKLAKGLLFLLGAAAVVLYAAGVFRGDRIEPGMAPEPHGVEAPRRTAIAQRTEVPVFEYAVGTVASRTRVGVAAQVTARIISIAANAGESVTRGETLVVLDDRELKARFEQAREGLEAAQANRDRQKQARIRAEALLTQAKARYDRIVSLRERGAATPEELEGGEAGLRAAGAGVDDATAAIVAAEARIQQADQVVAEARIALGHARIEAPIDGVVAERNAEPGDLAWAGRNLLVVLDPKALRLEAQVREGRIAHVRLGQRLRIELPAAETTVEGSVSEIIPWADPNSRTFRVHIDFEPVPGVYPGMFGRLRLPIGSRDVLHVPREAVTVVGQLDTVLVRIGDRWERRLITTGGVVGDDGVEVLSGLRGGESVGLTEQR